MLIEGVFAAVTTPFYPDERIYLRKLEANMARYSRSLLAGMVVLGSTGEAVALNDAETHDVLRVAAEATTPEKVLIAGVGRDSVRATVETAEAAARFGYDAVLLRLPTYYAGVMTAEQMLNYFQNVADRSPLPVLLYNIPRYVPAEIPVEVVAELALHPNVIGIKESSGKMERISALIAATKNAPRHEVAVTGIFEAVTGRMLKAKTTETRGESNFVPTATLTGTAAAVAAPVEARTRTKEVGFQVLSGALGTFMDSLEAGAAGAILAFGACAPQACQEVYLAWKDRDYELARTKQARIARAGNRIVAGLGISGVKYGCDFNGYFGGRTRLPLLPLRGEQKREIEGLLEGIRN